jgi:cellulose biosynthesis protein BcsQ
MAEILASSAVTAIHNSDFESFTASTLFGQGWSVLFRALDANSLAEFIEQSKELPEVLLISSDLSGIHEETLEKLRRRGIKVFLFCSSQEDVARYPTAHIQPKTGLDLIGLIRGSLRAPMLRPHITTSAKPQACIISLVSPHHGAGCTSLSINLAAELSLLDKRVLLLDAHPHFPAIATRLAQRGLHQRENFHKVSAQLSAGEVTQENIADNLTLLDAARAEFDFIIIDNGVIQDLPLTLSGRRWSGELLVWAATHADQMWVVSKSDYLSLESLKRLCKDLSKNSVKPLLSFVHSHCLQGKKGALQEHSFLEIVTPLRPQKILKFPLDSRSLTAAENERLPLHESNEKSLLRKSVADIAGELTR